MYTHKDIEIDLQQIHRAKRQYPKPHTFQAFQYQNLGTPRSHSLNNTLDGQQLSQFQQQQYEGPSPLKKQQYHYTQPREKQSTHNSISNNESNLMNIDKEKLINDYLEKQIQQKKKQTGINPINGKNQAFQSNPPNFRRVNPEKLSHKQWKDRNIALEMHKEQIEQDKLIHKTSKTMRNVMPQQYYNQTVQKQQQNGQQNSQVYKHQRSVSLQDQGYQTLRNMNGNQRYNEFNDQQELPSIYNNHNQNDNGNGNTNQQFDGSNTISYSNSIKQQEQEQFAKIRQQLEQDQQQQELQLKQEQELQKIRMELEQQKLLQEQYQQQQQQQQQSIQRQQQEQQREQELLEQGLKQNANYLQLQQQEKHQQNIINNFNRSLKNNEKIQEQQQKKVSFSPLRNSSVKLRDGHKQLLKQQQYQQHQLEQFKNQQKLSQKSLQFSGIHNNPREEDQIKVSDGFDQAEFDEEFKKMQEKEKKHQLQKEKLKYKVDEEKELEKKLIEKYIKGYGKQKKQKQKISLIFTDTNFEFMQYVQKDLEVRKSAQSYIKDEIISLPGGAAGVAKNDVYKIMFQESVKDLQEKYIIQDIYVYMFQGSYYIEKQIKEKVELIQEQNEDERTREYLSFCVHSVYEFYKYIQEQFNSKIDQQQQLKEVEEEQEEKQFKIKVKGLFVDQQGKVEQIQID